MSDLLRRLLNLTVQASTIAPGIDALHFFIILVTMAGAFAVFTLAMVYVVRYRRPAHPKDGHARHRAPGRTRAFVEVGLLVTLVSLFVGWWVIGFRQYVEMRMPPADSLEVYVSAKQWMWTFVYPDGRRSNGVLYVPANRPIKLVMTSRDVIHSFYVPEFRIKQDVVPGRTTTVWFEATAPGTYQILCTEYCGTDHSTMRATVIALSAADFERSLTPRDPGPMVAAASSLAAEGQRVAVEHGCYRCHTEDGTAHIGPTWGGLYGSTIELDSGERIVVDEAYLTESMMDPKAKIRRGYRAVMPAYVGLVDAPEVAAIVERIKASKDVEAGHDPPPEDAVLEVYP